MVKLFRMIRTYQRRNRGGESNSQLSDAFSPPRNSDSQDLIASYHSALSSQDGFSEGGASQQLGVARLGSLSSRLDLFAFDDEEETEKKVSSEKRTGGGSPVKKTNSRAEGASGQLSNDPSARAGLLNSALKGSLAKSPLLAGGFGHGLRYFSGAVQSSTLMEHQESGEMQESVDEAKFALEGLNPSSSLPVLRASVVALVQLLSSSGKRRVLQAHGLGQPLLTAIMALPEGESLLRLASAAVVYFLSMDDVAHRSLLDSDDVIRLVLSFLEQRNEIEKQAEKPKGIFASSKGVGKGVADQAKKVQKLFQDGMNADLTGGQAVSPEWLGLLALEQASMAAAQLEQEASIGGAKSLNQFKDRLREQGGLATVCHLAASCQEELSNDVSKEPVAAHATMLLRCLRILEHVTYVSEENQQHLLELRLSENEKNHLERGDAEADTCVEVVLGCIEALSPTNGEKSSQKRRECNDNNASALKERGTSLEASGLNFNGKEMSDKRGKTNGEKVKGGTGGAAKPVGKWQSAARRKQEATADEVIPDSDEEALIQDEKKSASVQIYKDKEARKGAALPLKEAGPRRSGRFSKLLTNGSDVAMELDTETRGSDDVTHERPPILRTFSRKKQKTEPFADPRGESTFSKPQTEVRVLSRRPSQDLELAEEEVADVQKLSSQASLQSRGKRKTKEASQELPDGKGRKEESRAEKSALSAFDFEVEPEVGPSGRGLERKGSGSRAGRKPGNKGKQAVKNRTIFDVDDFEEEEPSVSGKSNGQDGKFVKEERKVPALLGRLTKGGTSANYQKGSQDSKVAATSAFDFKPAVERREREGLATSEELDSEGREENGRRETHLELDKGLVSECLVTCVKVLMNLTNDNANGCQQIAAAGGLHAIASLLIARCPPLRNRTKQPSKASQRSSALLLNLEESVQASDMKSAAVRASGPDAAVSMPEADVSKVDADVSNSDGPPEDLDLVTVVLALLVNLVEKDRHNRLALAALDFPVRQNPSGEPLEGRVGVVQSLCALFLSKKGAGAKADSAENEAAALEFDEEIRLAEGQREAEDMIVEAYAALLIALLAKDDIRARKTVAEILPEGNGSSLAPVLERFMNFHLQMNTFSPDAHEALLELIEACKMPID